MEMETTLQKETETGAEQSAVPGELAGIASAVANQHGAGPEIPESGSNGAAPAAKRRGRPPKHGRYSKAAGSDGHNAAPLPGGTAVAEPEMESQLKPAVSIPPHLLAKVFQKGIGAGETYAQSKIRKAAALCGLQDQDISEQLTAAKIDEESKALAGDLVPLAMEEWGVDPQMSPTCALLFLLSPWVISSCSAYFTLAKLAAERAAALKKMEKETQRGEK